MALFIEIIGDTNDADYISKTSEISKEDLDNKLRPLFEKIRQFKPYKVKVDGLEWTHRNNFPFGENCREDLGEKSVEELYGIDEEFMEFLYDIIPGDFENEIHTITSAEVFEKANQQSLL